MAIRHKHRSSTCWHAPFFFDVEQVLSDQLFERVSTVLKSHGLGHFSDLSSPEQITLLEEAHRDIMSENNKVSCPEWRGLLIRSRAHLRYPQPECGAFEGNSSAVWNQPPRWPCSFKVFYMSKRLGSIKGLEGSGHFFRYMPVRSTLPSRVQRGDSGSLIWTALYALRRCTRHSSRSSASPWTQRSPRKPGKTKDRPSGVPSWLSNGALFARGKFKHCVPHGGGRFLHQNGVRFSPGAFSSTALQGITKHSASPRHEH